MLILSRKRLLFLLLNFIFINICYSKAAAVGGVRVEESRSCGSKRGDRPMERWCAETTGSDGFELRRSSGGCIR